MEVKVLFSGEWLSIREKDGYEYLHEDRCNGNIVAVLVFDSNRPGEILGRYESCAAHSRRAALCSLTGGLDDLNKSLKRQAIEEVQEESGYVVNEGQLIWLGEAFPYKAADTVVTMFAVDVAGLTPGQAVGDGSQRERDSFCEWVNEQDAIFCSDPLVAAMIARLNLVKNG